MRPDESLSLELRHGSGAYALRGVSLVEGRGARLIDDRGNIYIDCISGHGAAILGHGHDGLRRALAEQAARLISCPGSFANDVRARALAALAAITGFARFFLCNSGAEACEGALKIARLATSRTRVVAARRGFHGRTFGALSATWEPRYRKPFEPLVPDVDFVSFNDVDAIREAVDDKTAAVMVEVIQGEGGVWPATVEFLSTLRRRCDATGALLILDEVQTGFGRTGELFAYHHYRIGNKPLRPDILVLAKGIAGGVPMGVIAFGPRVGMLPRGSHGSTFGGNPLACAACLATLSAIEQERLVERSRLLGGRALKRLRDGLRGQARVRDVRGRGLMIGIELRQRVNPFLRRLSREGVLALGAGPVVLRLLPPLVIDEVDLERALTKVIQVLAAVDAECCEGSEPAVGG